MVFRATKQAWLASGLVLAFPVLLLSIPRGAGIFLGAVVLAMLLGWRGMGQTMARYRSLLVPLGLAILAVLAVSIASKLLFGLRWSAIDNPTRALLALLTCLLVLRHRPDSRMLWYGIPLALVSCLLIVAYQFLVLHDDRPAAWTQPIAFANMVAAFGLIGFARPGHLRRDHALAWGGLAVAGAVLVLNGSRGAWLSLAVTMVPLLAVRYRRIRLPAFVGMVVLLAALAGALYALPGSPVAKRVDLVGQDVAQFEAGNADTSTGARLLIWQMAAKAFEAHPWTGIGLGQFRQLTQALPACQVSRSHQFCLEHAHNDVMEALATMGVPGLVAVMSIFLVPAWLFFRLLGQSRRQADERGECLAAAGLAVVMSSLIGGLTQVTMAHQANIVFYAGVIGLLLGLAAVQAKYPRADGVENP
ncbi:O-antigen ligase family protein [Cupriavidus basilensis]|uniref:O-antigen ligase family protein n=1 Tax=Cupriavidus basilensis TaxID=68895 RepID=A0ABT6AVN3_9BURK|nr:O-antigen ligase family protein [Cupriavidus basilensis]MDF3836685.1 O-antigen ligase family protein [Cupriavidus basilensis]